MGWGEGVKVTFKRCPKVSSFFLGLLLPKLCLHPNCKVPKYFTLAVGLKPAVKHWLSTHLSLNKYFDILAKLIKRMAILNIYNL